MKQPFIKLVRPSVVLLLIGLPTIYLAGALGVSSETEPLQLATPGASLAGVGIQQLLSPPTPPPPPPTPPKPRNAAEQADDGVLSGRLLSSDGRLASGIRITATPVATSGSPAISGSAETGIGGVYRIENLPPGTYILRAGLTTACLNCVSTYYPGVTEVSRASRVVLKARQSVTGLDFMLDPKAGVRVSGRVTPLPRAILAAHKVITVTLGRGASTPGRVPRGLSFLSVPVEADGTFEFPLVPRGEYGAWVLPETDSGDAAPRFTVTDRDVRGIELAAPILWSGRVVVQGTQGLPPIPQDPVVSGGNRSEPRSLINVKAVATRESSVVSAPVWMDGVFAIPLEKGEYRMSVEVPFGYYVKSISFGRDDLLQKAMSVTGPLNSEVLVTLTTAPADSTRAGVTIRGHAGRIPPNTYTRTPLVAVLTGEGVQGFGLVPVNSDGKFEFHNVPPGTYDGYVTVPAERKSYGRTVVVAGKDLIGIELPFNPNIVHDKK